MKFLLDTCTALWYFEGSDRIGSRLRDTLTDLQNELFLSDVSILEIVIKHQLGKLSLERSPSQILLPLAEKHLMDILPLTSEAIFVMEKLPLLHRDPFDRLLIAQAQTHDLILLTPDPLFRQYDVNMRWA
ncbi:hypothetical protein ES703_47378 [subsurface metagenome]